jgi:hypothetical protein
MPPSSLQAPVGAFEDVTLDSMGKLTSTEASLGEEKLNQPRSFRRLRLPGQERKPEPTLAAERWFFSRSKNSGDD